MECVIWDAPWPGQSPAATTLASIRLSRSALCGAALLSSAQSPHHDSAGPPSRTAPLLPGDFLPFSIIRRLLSGSGVLACVS